MARSAHLTVSIEVLSKKKKLKSLNAHIHIHLRKFVIFPAIGLLTAKRREISVTKGSIYNRFLSALQKPIGELLKMLWYVKKNLYDKRRMIAFND